MSTCKCTVCPHAKWEYVYGERFNIKCLKANPLSKFDEGRTIDYGIKQSENVETPFWCPLKDEKKEPLMLTTSSTTVKTCKNWKDIKPLTDWSKISSGKILHYPPSPSHSKRCDIVVIWACSSYFSYRELNGDTTTTAHYMYQTDVDSRIIVEKREI